MTNDKQRERLVDLLKSSNKDVATQLLMGSCDERIKNLDRVNELRADYLLANGVIVPPCKVGQTVWANRDCFYLSYTEHGKVIPCEVIGIKETKKGKYILLKPLLIETYGMRRVNRWFPFSVIGKTVFLTEEEAEQALNNVQNGNSCEGGVQG